MQDEAFHRITADIITHPLFTQMQSFVHHGGENSLYDHSVDTAKCAYRLARKFHMREERVEAVTRAALLHDFFGYDWRSDAHKQFLRHYSGLRRLTHMHAFVHGAMAARRANRLFGLDERQRSAITSHMFPLAPIPKNSEGWVLTLADKMVASREMSATIGWHMRKWYRKMGPSVSVPARRM